MSKFLVLSKRIINIRYIRDIVDEKNMYVITLASSQNITGYMLYGCGFVGNNNFDKLYVENNEKNELENSDYDKISKFIKSIGYIKDDVCKES